MGLKRRKKRKSMFSKDLCFRVIIKVIIFLIPMWPNYLFAQTVLKIDGQVLTEDKLPIMDANIILKSKTGAIISYKSSDKSGKFFFEIKSYVKEFLIETSYLGFQKDIHPISFKESNEIISLIILLKPTTTNLREIYIAYKPGAISIKNDTTTYKVSHFLTGNEEVVEDVLKKLPGVEVSENGKITYKGKSINKVLIEGDDLFSKNYQIGTKNIKSVILDEVQAIENYVENEKLVGFKNTNETVLNLKIKEEAKNTPNLSISLAYGYNRNYQMDNNLIGVSKTFKYFIFNNMNNVGLNPTPYEYFNFNPTSEGSLELSSNQTKIIGIDYSLPILGSKRGNVNRNYFSTGNAFLKLKKSLNLTANYNLYSDKISLIKNSLMEFGKLADGVSFTEYKSITKKPLIGDASLRLLFDISKKSNLKYISNFSSSTIKSSEELTANYGTFVNSLRDKSNSLEQSLEYTNRLSTNSALKIKGIYFFINQPQNYSLSSDLKIVDDSLNGQTTNLTNHIFNVKSEYILKTTLFTHSLTFQYDKKIENLASSSLGSKLFKNDLVKDDDHIDFGYTNTLSLKSVQLSTGLLYKFKDSKILGDEIGSLRNTVNFLSPILNLHYRLNKNDKFTIANSYDRFLPELTDLYQNYILIDNKSLNRGVYQKSVISRYSLITTFIHSDLFNQFIYFLNLIYIKNSKSYGTSQEISSNYIINNRTMFPGVENYILSGSISKYLPFIKSTIKYNHNLSWYQFYSRINNSAIKNYSAFNSGQLLEIKSGFDGWLNFESGVKYNTTRFRSVENENHNAQLYSTFILRISEKLSFSFLNERYFNNLKSLSYQKYNFLDANAKFSLNKKTTLKLVGKNLTNNQFFNTKTINQFSTSTASYSLLPASLLFEVSYRF